MTSVVVTYVSDHCSVAEHLVIYLHFNFCRAVGGHWKSVNAHKLLSAPGFQLGVPSFSAIPDFLLEESNSGTRID